MTSSDRPSGSAPSTTALSEALEQAADAAKLWCEDIAGFVKGEADKVASNRYRLGDLFAAPVSLMRINLKSTIAAAYVLQDNLALLSYSRPRTPAPPKTVHVLAHIPAKVTAKFVASDLIGQQGYRIASSKIKILSKAPSVENESRDVVVDIEVDAPHAPPDVYEGNLTSAGLPVVTAPVTCVLYELGTTSS